MTPGPALQHVPNPQKIDRAPHDFVAMQHYSGHLAMMGQMPRLAKNL
jgi:hypothetical protein